MKALVEFVGAGPGAEDLITVRGLRALEQADLVVYAGSLVNPAHLKACKANCTCLDSASMNLGEQIEAMSDAALAGKRVVRLHTGDPAMYGAINEQIRGLAQKGVAASIIRRGNVFAAAAALGCELTSPDVSQSVVLTRTRKNAHASRRRRRGLRPDQGDAGLFDTGRSATDAPSDGTRWAGRGHPGGDRLPRLMA
ncbi:MAG: cobalt-precorrin-4/precorrin-4 C(11)-methyltransferase [Bilophila wadsworthia]